MLPRPSLIAPLLAAVLIAGCGSSSSSTTAASSTATSSSLTAEAVAGSVGFEGVKIEPGVDLAPAGTTGTADVDGIHCGPTEQLLYHIHAHLTVYVNGEPRAIPAGIGIPGSQVEQTTSGPVAAGGQCIYWLHTHAPDGIIHVESPTQRVYTLGDFFDEWHQPLSSSRIAGSSGSVTAIINGKRWAKDPRLIPLLPHAVIQLSVGQPVPPFHSMSWSGLQL